MKHFKPILKATLLLMFATIAMKASAYDFYEGGIYYTITDWDAVEVSAPDYYSTYSGDIVIPSTVTVQVSQYYESYPMTYTVTGIGYNAFNGSYISSITLPNTIELTSAASRCPTPLSTLTALHSMNATTCRKSNYPARCTASVRAPSATARD